ncbi:DedA family protein [Catelliglobosispora koreensis]|uniref:DedA family protein n=1 Tax=Catelliglobosispora koreensis TaxID=129052 RepID=UPI0003680245|nr:VTT domain-containing protein [Catelliglobosispora koreensis]
MNTIHAVAEVASFNPLNPTDWLQLFGSFAVYGVWFILFAETGLLAGFFLPGDSLLIVAGVLATGAGTALGIKLDIVPLLIGGPIFAILGAQLGHWLGVKYGRKLFDKPNSRLFKKEYVEKAEHYFQKFGPRKAVVLARFIPIVRTFLNPVAGVLGMPAKQFFVWNVVGAILWVDGILLVGYYAGDTLVDLIGGPDKIDKYIIPFVLVIVLISAIPIFIEMARERRAKRAKVKVDVNA